MIQCDERKIYLSCMMVIFSLVVAISTAWGGSMRINMKDGTFVDVPYFWEENGEYKFEMAGGEAGVPKSQVTSVQEVVISKEFDPEVLIEDPQGTSGTGQEKALQEIIDTKFSSKSGGEKLDPEESLKLLKMVGAGGKGIAPSKERVFGPSFMVEGDFAELVKKDENDVTLVVRNVISSRNNLKGHSINLVLYDGEGNVIQTKPCEVIELDIDPKTMKTLGLGGNLYCVMGSIKPDSRIKRYEISSNQR